MSHGNQQPRTTVSSNKNVITTSQPTNTVLPSGSTRTPPLIVSTETQDEKVRVFKRIEQTMEGFQSKQASQFHTISNVIDELNKWTNTTDEDRDRALNTYMAEINSCTSGLPKNELTSSTQPSTSSFPLVVDQKRPQPGENGSPDHLFQTRDKEEEDESVHGRKQAWEEDMP